MNLRIREIKDRQEWLGWRRSNINASELAGVMGIGKYASPFSLWHEKHGTAPEREGSDLMHFGLLAEDLILEMLRRKHPDWRIEKQHHYYEDTDLRIGATPDAFAWAPDREGKGNIQLKTHGGIVFDKDYFDDDGELSAPIDYQIQALGETKLCGCSWTMVAPLVLSDFRRELAPVDVPVDDKAWTGCLKATAAFWKLFDKGGPVPAVTAQDDDFIKALFPKEDGSVVDLSGDNELPEIIASLHSDQEALAMMKEKIQLKEVEDRIKGYKTRIKAKLGSAVGAVLSEWELTCKTVQVNAKPYHYRDLRIKRRKR